MSKQIRPIKEVLSRFPLRMRSGRVVKMGVGCAYLGSNGKGDDDPDPIGRDVKLLEDCYSAGFRLFDTSADYGISEEVVGRFVSQIPRDKIFLATKAPFPFREKDGFERFKAIFYKSFERLKTDRIDLYQIHDTDDYPVCIPEVIPFLRERQAEGMIDYVGMGTRSLVMLELGILDGGLDSVLSYLEYSILKTAAARLIDVAGKTGAAFINASTLHFGVVKAENPLAFRDWHTEEKPLYGYELHIRESAAKMRAHLDSIGVPVIPAALQISLFHKGIDMTLSGIRKASNLVSTLEALDHEIYPEQWASIFETRDSLPFVDVQDRR